MKYINKVLLVCTVACLFLSCSMREAEKPEPVVQIIPAPMTTQTNRPILSFENTLYQFEKVTAGTKVVHQFKFKNTGKSPLIITDAKTTCGCTVPSYPRKPVEPGEEGIISVEFDSTGKIGIQNKLIEIISNADPTITELFLNGYVEQLPSNSRIHSTSVAN